MPGEEEDLSRRQKSVLAYVTANAGDREVPLAVEGGAHSAAAYLINSDVPVVGMGGFVGSDNAPSVQLLTAWQQRGQLGFVQLGGGPGGPGGGPNGPPPNAAGGPGGRSATSRQRQDWVRQHCTPVDPVAYGGNTEEDGGMRSPGQLYDCRG